MKVRSLLDFGLGVHRACNRQHVWTVWGLFIVSVVLQSLAFGQAGVRSVQGVVTDKGGNPLRSTVVQLEDQTTLQIRSYLTGPDGRYSFRELSSDVDYQIRATLRERPSSVKTLSRFNSKTTANIDLRIDLPAQGNHLGRTANVGMPEVQKSTKEAI